MEEEKRRQYITSVERIGMQQGQAEMLLGVLGRRFGLLPADFETCIRALHSQQLTQLLDVALDAATLHEVASAVEALSHGAGNGNSPAT